MHGMRSLETSPKCYWPRYQCCLAVFVGVAADVFFPLQRYMHLSPVYPIIFAVRCAFEWSPRWSLAPPPPKPLSPSPPTYHLYPPPFRFHLHRERVLDSYLLSIETGAEHNVVFTNHLLSVMASEGCSLLTGFCSVSFEYQGRRLCKCQSTTASYPHKGEKTHTSHIL